MVLPEDSSNPIVEVLKEIADSLDKNTEILNRICSHYDSVVPVMARNAKRAEEMVKEEEKGFAQSVKNIFAPQEH